LTGIDHQWLVSLIGNGGATGGRDGSVQGGKPARSPSIAALVTQLDQAQAAAYVPRQPR
jgi:hypothetical protein